LSLHYFLDTSALAKYYHVESGTDRVTEIVDDSNNTIILSQISILEFHSHLASKARTGERPSFGAEGFHRVCGLLCYHIVSGKFQVINLPQGFIFKATDLIRYHGCVRSLRHMDAIQLCSYLDYLQLRPDAILVASDKKLLGIVKHLGLEYLNPEE